MGPGTVVLVVLVIFVIIFVASGIRIVRQAEVMVIERLGKYHATLKSGINIIIPIVDKPRKIRWKYVKVALDGRTLVIEEEKARIDLRERVYDFPRQRVITKDNVTIEINGLLYFQITDPVRSVYEIENLPDAIEKLTQTTLRNVIGEMELDQVLVSRDVINHKLKNVLDEASDKWGVKVNRVEIQDIVPPEEVRQSMEKQMKAERDKRATILEAEGLKRAKILEAEGVKEAEINKAEGFRRAKILVAEGEAEAIALVTKALSQAKADPANYLIAIKYIEALKEMVSGKNNKVVYIPFEATGILSSIGGIKDMLEEIRKTESEKDINKTNK